MGSVQQNSNLLVPPLVSTFFPLRRLAHAPWALPLFPSLKGLPAVCIALPPQISALLCLCLKFHLSKMFATQQVSLKALTHVWESFFFSFQFLFFLCIGNVSLFGFVGANVLWSFFCYPWVLPMSVLLYRVGCTLGKMRRVSSSMVLFSGRTYYKAREVLRRDVTSAGSG